MYYSSDDNRYKPYSAMLPHERKESYPCSVYLVVREVVSGGEENDKALDLLLRLFGNNKFYVTNNGSFHEYNISIWTMPSRAYYYNRYQARAGDYEKRDLLYTPVNSDTYVNDYTQIFIDEDLYRIYKKYDVPWVLYNSYTDSTPESELKARKVSKDDLPALIEKESERAVRAWKLSKDNYNESVESKTPETPEEICEEDEGWSQASHVILLGAKKRQAP